MKTFFFLLFLIAFISCTATEDTSYEDSSAVTAIDPEITALKIRVTKLEAQNVIWKRNDSIKTIKISYLEKDSMYQAKQIILLNTYIIALKKVDSIDNVQDKAEVVRSKDFDLRYIKDSIAKGVRIGKLEAVPSLAPDLKFNRLMDIKDSIAKSTAIKILQSTAPTVQIPIIQADIVSIKSKNVSQDKILIAHTSSIKNVEDTMKSLIRDVGSDFTLDEKKKLIISKQGIDRIKAALPLP